MCLRSLSEPDSLVSDLWSVCNVSDQTRSECGKDLEVLFLHLSMFLLSFYNIFVNIFAKRMLSEFWVCAYLRLLDKQSGSFLTECLFDIHKPRHLEWSHS